MNSHQNLDLIINEQTLPVITQLAQSMPGGFFIYHAEGDGELIYFNSRMTSIFGCHSDDEFREYVHNSFRGIVHPDDYDRVLKDIDRQIEGDESAVDRITYRIKKKDGGVALLEDYGRLSHSDSYGDIFYVFAYEISLLKEEQRAFTSHFLKSYLTAFYVDLNDLDALVIKNAFNPQQEGSHIKNCFDVLFRRVVEGSADNMKPFGEMLSPDYVREQLRHNQVLTHTFQDNVGGSTRIVMMEIVSGPDEDHVVFGFKDVTEENLKEHARQQELKLALDRAEEESLRTNLVYQVNNAGQWSYEIDSNDAVVAAHYSSRTRGMVDLDYSGSPMAWVDHVHPEDKEKVKSAFIAAISDHSGETVYNEDFRMIGREGKTTWVKSAGRMFRHDDGSAEFIGLTIDITEQIEKEREQHALSDGLAREYHTVWLVDGFGEHLLHLYRSTGKTTVKKAVALGLRVPSYDSAMTQYVMDSVHEDDRERVLEATRFETVARETPDVGTYVVSYKRYNDEGNVDYHQMCFAKAAANDGTINYILAYRDADKMLREQIAMQDRLKEALEMAKSANQAKTAFLNNMSHDIRTPMNAILGYTSMTQKHIDDKKRALDFLNKITIAGNNMLGLVNQVLDMSRIESGTVALKEEPADVVEKAYEMVELIGHSAHAKNIKVATQINPIQNRKVYADGIRMNQLILNILGNSVKYTPEGGHIKYTVTQLDCDRPGYGTYKFEIEDDGIGMSKEYVKKIFEPFSRENSSTVSKIQGTGLGMSIVKKLVDLMGGKINVESEQGKGTRTTIVISFRLNEDGETFSPSGDQISKGGVLNGKRVLLVDDNEMNREIAVMLLNEQGMTVHTAEDGDVAVRKVKSLAEKGQWNYYDFILMDVQMPRMGGYEATRLIRKIYEPSGIHIPVIALSANAFEEDRQNSLNAGMDEHIAKPIDVNALWETMAKFL